MVSYRDIPFGDGLEKPLFFTHDLLFEKNRTNIVFIVQRTQKIFTKFAMRIWRTGSPLDDIISTEEIIGILAERYEIFIFIGRGKEFTKKKQKQKQKQKKTRKKEKLSKMGLKHDKVSQQNI